MDNTKAELIKVLKSYDEAIEELSQHHNERSRDRLADARENLALALVTFFESKESR